MKSDQKIYQHFIKLRLLVGYLGEKRQGNWWDTSFFDQTGRRFLESTFPRTVLASALRSTTEAARLVHDARIGGKGAYHLFRLPVDQEVFLEAHINDSLEANPPSFLSSKEAALEELSQCLPLAFYLTVAVPLPILNRLSIPTAVLMTLSSCFFSILPAHKKFLTILLFRSSGPAIAPAEHI